MGDLTNNLFLTREGIFLTDLYSILVTRGRDNVNYHYDYVDLINFLNRDLKSAINYSKKLKLFYLEQSNLVENFTLKNSFLTESKFMGAIEEFLIDHSYAFLRR